MGSASRWLTVAVVVLAVAGSLAVISDCFLLLGYGSHGNPTRQFAPPLSLIWVVLGIGGAWLAAVLAWRSARIRRTGIHAGRLPWFGMAAGIVGLFGLALTFAWGFTVQYEITQFCGDPSPIACHPDWQTSVATGFVLNIFAGFILVIGIGLILVGTSLRRP